jgi:hypothetical protein
VVGVLWPPSGMPGSDVESAVREVKRCSDQGSVEELSRAGARAGRLRARVRKPASPRATRFQGGNPRAVPGARDLEAA